MSTNTTLLQFESFQSNISTSFWNELTKLKLNVLKLSTDPIVIHGHYDKGKIVKDKSTGNEIGLGCLLELDSNSFNQIQSGSDRPSTSSKQQGIRTQGILYNYNTIEEFKKADKAALLSEVADSIWNISHSNAPPTASTSSATISPPANVEPEKGLNPFIILTFADLKKYKYFYWCGFPALLQKPGWEMEGSWKTVDINLLREVEEYRESCAEGFSLARPARLSVATPYVEEEEQGISPQLEFGSLASLSTFFEGVAESDRTLVFLDPSSHLTALGWPLRNVLFYLFTAYAVTSIKLIAHRSTAHSRQGIISLSSTSYSLPSPSQTKPAVVGWERSDLTGKLQPKLADLAPLLDPKILADSAVDLNLQLMKWRIMPELNLEKVKKTKVLLLGAGTLGCYVARTLMAWGVRKITFVDSSTVSFSNPVRQPLFEFTDSLDGGKPKAQAAADALLRIYPGVEATGIHLSIPMPGHPIPPKLIEKTKDDIKTLEKLIDEHDVVYLLMDSRESRWLPTVIGASKRKLVMNVALGFDTFLVMRHGVPTVPGEEAPTVPASIVPGSSYTGQLGCYYCNDVVAPMDSLTDRTLDQMCTVTRPGIASIASSTAVELMVSILQHPKGIYAPSDVPIGQSTSGQQKPEEKEFDPKLSSPLGIVPHQIRGYLAQFNNLKITGQAYNRCTGCSEIVRKAYEMEGYEMLSQAFEDAKYLERLTGLDKLYEESERLMEGMEEWDEEEEE